MAWSHECVVLIASGREASSKPLGTGTVIAPGRVLTARHVVFDREGQPKGDLVVRREGSTAFLPATVMWPGSVNLDVAVLEADIGVQPLAHPLACLSARPIRVAEPWEAKGYPKVRAEKPSVRMEVVKGTTCSSDIAEHVSLDCTVHPGVWDGLSGAAIVIDGRVVGVARAIPTGWDGKRLEATPVAAFLDDPTFREALGLSPEDERLFGRVARIVDGVADSLKKRPRVAAALARNLAISPTPSAVEGTIASELVNSRKAMEVAKALNHVDSELATSGADVEDRRTVQSLLFQILPFAIDWWQLVIVGRSSLAGPSSSIELPLRTETVAEIVLAGIDDRRCRFVLPSDRGSMPVGAALVRMPAAAQTPFFDTDGTHLAMLVVQQLAAQLHIEESYRSDSELQKIVEDELKYYAREGPPADILPYYLVFDAARDAVGSTRAAGVIGEHDLWALVRTALGRALPSLRLVRLTGGSIGEEWMLAKHINAICRRTP